MWLPSPNSWEAPTLATACPGRTPGALEEAGVERDTADRRRGDQLHEGARDLRQHGPQERRPSPGRSPAAPSPRRSRSARRRAARRRPSAQLRLADAPRRTSTWVSWESRKYAASAPAMKLTRVRGLIRSSRAGSIGACGRISSTCLPDLREQVLLAGLLQRLVDGLLLGVLLRAQRLAVAAACGRLLRGLAGLASLPARDASRTASRSRWARSLASCRSVVRVLRLSAMGWSSGRLSATASGPEHVDRGGHRPLGADPQPERGQQLGDVHPQHQVAGRDLAAAQVRQDRPCRNGPPAARPRPAAGARCAATAAPRPAARPCASARR